MKKKRQPAMDLPQKHSFALIVVGAAFLLGGILGVAVAKRAAGGEADALLEYIQGYWSAARTTGVMQPTLWPLIWETVRFPLLAFVLGFTALGMVGMPILFFARGFLFAFSATCFVCMFGASGGLLTFLILGISGAAAVPPLFVLGTQGIEASQKLLSRYLGARKDGAVYSKAYFFRVGTCAAVLACCVLFDYFAAPALIKLLAGIL